MNKINTNMDVCYTQSSNAW